MREHWQQWENRFLAPWAAHSEASLGRRAAEPECPLRTVWQRDRDRIIHSKAFRRLKHKAQVFVDPEGDHFRTRLTHTLEVAQISRTIARALCLNEDLTEAIALGHDLGHTPFGHAGERALAAVAPGFSHNSQSLRVVDIIEREGQGLNLTQEVRDGILHHSGRLDPPASLEGRVVRYCDRIAYLNHDIDDAMRGGYLRPHSLPASTRNQLGETHSQRINTMVMDMVRESAGQPEISMSPACERNMLELREFMFENFYYHADRLAEEQWLNSLVQGLYGYFLEHDAELPDEYRREPYPVAVCDYIAGMTDNFALAQGRRLGLINPQA